jgi:methanogenic corrinoid protein MtbC1
MRSDSPFTTRLISPRDLARAIGVSESSVKRWADDGLVRFARTGGGHRRIAVSEAVRFIRHSGSHVLRPDLLGLPDLGNSPVVTLASEDATDALYRAMEQGEPSRVNAVIQGLYLGGMTIAALCDGPLRQALHKIGELWLHQEWGIVVEHRATDACIRALNHLRLLQPIPPDDAPVAVGGAAEEDTYIIPSLMAAAVCAEVGFRDINLGPRTPLRVVRNAAERYGARLVWLSMSGHASVRPLLPNLLELTASLAAQGRQVVVGGRPLSQLAARETLGMHVAGSMTELAAFARGLLTGGTGAGGGTGEAGLGDGGLPAAEGAHQTENRPSSPQNN